MPTPEETIKHNALDYQKNGKAPLVFKDKKLNREYGDWFTSIHKHFTDTVIKDIWSHSEHFVEYWPVYCLWGHRQQTKVGNSFTEPGRQFAYTEMQGTYGAGYLCLSDGRIYLVCLQKASQQHPMFYRGAMSLFLGAAIGEMDNRIVTSKDRYWEIPYHTVLGAQPIETDTGQRLRIVTGSETWEIREWVGRLEEITEGISMGMTGQLAALWKPAHAKASPALPTEIVELLKQLDSLKRAGILTEAEFEEKKRTLLSRI